MDVITIGDAMIAMCPREKGPIIFSDTFKRKVGGAELNVAIGCARLGLKAGFISRLGNDDFGKYIIKTARGEDIDISEVKLVDGYQTSYSLEKFYQMDLVDHFIIEKMHQQVQ